MVVPIEYRRATEGVITSYDYVDIASGTGYINFYAGITSSTTDYSILSNFTFYSGDTNWSSAVGSVGGVWTEFTTRNFDVTCNKPMTLRGLAFINVPVYATAGAYTKCNVTIYKVVGSAATSLGTNETAAAHGAYRMTCAGIQIAQTQFKKGDILRLNVQTMYNTSAGGETVGSAFDPKGRTTGWDATGACPSTTIFYCPVRIDL